VGSTRNIGVSQDIRRAVYRCLEPPYEELFDAAEEHSLSILYVAWVQMIVEDNKTYGKVNITDFKLFFINEQFIVSISSKILKKN